MSDQQINIAIVGLGFGAEFIPIYQRHPNANMAAICQRTQSTLDEIGDKYGVEKRYNDYDALLIRTSMRFTLIPRFLIMRRTQ
jgi:predicted dehydrogenase